MVDAVFPLVSNIFQMRCWVRRLITTLTAVTFRSSRNIKRFVLCELTSSRRFKRTAEAWVGRKISMHFFGVSYDLILRKNWDTAGKRFDRTVTSSEITYSDSRKKKHICVNKQKGGENTTHMLLNVGTWYSSLEKIVHAPNTSGASPHENVLLRTNSESF